MNLHRVGRRPGGRRSPGVALPGALAIFAALLVACSGINSSFAPSASFRPLGSGETPTPTSWPASVVEATIALGLADGQFSQIGNDLSAAVDSGDLQRVLKASLDVQTFLTENGKNIPKLQAYADTQPLGDALKAAYDKMLEGITKVHDSLVTGDSAGVTAGFEEFAAGNDLYAPLRAELGDKATQAIFMKRILLR
jgi:hypothetical protein